MMYQGYQVGWSIGAGLAPMADRIEAAMAATFPGAAICIERADGWRSRWEDAWVRTPEGGYMEWEQAAPLLGAAIDRALA